MLVWTAAALLVCVVVAVVVVRRRRDEIYEGVTPGLTPAPGQPVRVGRVSGAAGEYNGPIAVQFTPPPGVTAGIVGTLVDGRADLRDVTAGLLDLAVRGAITIRGIPPEKSGGDPDWELEAVQLSGWEPWEDQLLAGLFSGRRTVLMSQLTQGRFGQAMREAQVELYRAVVRDGYYRRHPRAKNMRVSLVGYLVIAIGVVLLGYLGFLGAQIGVWYGWLGGAMVIAGGVVLAMTGRGRTPRTALGTAKRIQALGFKTYLSTAEADQIRYEEAQDIFSRYLPYAIAFGVTDHWATVFAEVAKRARLDGFAMAWTDVGYLDLSALIEVGAVLGDAADLAAIGIDADLVGSIDMPDLSGFGDLPDGGFGDLVGGVADFVGSGTDLSLPDGCDGCDLGGCDGCG
ncbi:MAG TPA: DUF2207 domain-containing protein [Propionibacteriaceae bacterium]|nr:DUF2207 domain-containing protein [Propionibacteriaceae bacterium]